MGLVQSMDDCLLVFQPLYFDFVFSNSVGFINFCTKEKVLNCI